MVMRRLVAVAAFLFLAASMPTSGPAWRRSTHLPEAMVDFPAMPVLAEASPAVTLLAECALVPALPRDPSPQPLLFVAL